MYTVARRYFHCLSRPVAGSVVHLNEAPDLDLVQICYDGSLATQGACAKQIHKKTDSYMYKMYFVDNIPDISLFGQLPGGKC